MKRIAATDIATDIVITEINIEPSMQPKRNRKYRYVLIIFFTVLKVIFASAIRTNSKIRVIYKTKFSLKGQTYIFADLIGNNKNICLRRKVQFFDK